MARENSLGQYCINVTDLERSVAFIKDPDGYLIELLQNHEGTRPSLR